MPETASEFRAPRWCRNCHVQTIWGPMFRRPRLRLRRERLLTSDGDFVDLDWCADEPSRDAPVLLVLHGLEGSSRSHYAQGLLDGARARGWRAAVVHFRSCSGEMNRLPRFYHSGDTGDLRDVVGQLRTREPGVRLVAAGVSIGGNVLLKWLGEEADAAPVAAAAAISVPFDLAACAERLDRGFAKAVYTANFMRTMRRKVVEKAQQYPGFVDIVAARRARTFAAYDAAVTAPLFGFADAREYWERASSRPYLRAIARPTLLLNALDDPFIPRHGLPKPDELSPHVRLVLTERGGHVGFLDGAPWRVGSWAERQVIGFLEARLAGIDAGAPRA
jgi:predicted alpha/beta-fold hydrolase